MIKNTFISMCVGLICVILWKILGIAVTKYVARQNTSSSFCEDDKYSRMRVVRKGSSEIVIIDKQTKQRQECSQAKIENCLDLARYHYKCGETDIALLYLRIACNGDDKRACEILNTE